MKEHKNEKIFPLLPLRGVVVFPKGIVNIEISRKKSIFAIEEAIKKDKKIFLVTQNILTVDSPKKLDLYNVGTVCEIKQFYKISTNEYRLLVLGKYKAKIKEFFMEEKMFSAKIVRVTEKLTLKKDEKNQALLRTIKKKFISYYSLTNIAGKEFLELVKNEQNSISPRFKK